jgi:heat shock protein HtpX
MNLLTGAVLNFLDFARKNPIYLACSFVYYLLSVAFLAWAWWAFFLVAAIYAIAMLVAFSPVGEMLMRAFNHVRRLETAREKNYLRPLFKEVVGKARAKNPELGKIDLFVIDSMNVNACAIGNHTIAVTKGAMSTFSEDELKAVLSHEIAHILNRDTAATLYTLIGNGIFMLIILPLKLLFAFVRVSDGFERVGAICEAIWGAIVGAFLFLMQLALSINSRKAERRADMYAITLGYGESMVEALYLLEKISLGGEGSAIKRLLASHPRVTARIERLEIALGVQAEEE